MLSSCVCFSGDESRSLIYFSHVGRGFSQLSSSPVLQSRVCGVKSMERVSFPLAVFLNLIMTPGKPSSSHFRLNLVGGPKISSSTK